MPPVKSDAPRLLGASGASMALNALRCASSRISAVKFPSRAAHAAALANVSIVLSVLGSR